MSHRLVKPIRVLGAGTVFAAALSLLPAGCGGGMEGTPVAPPTTPAPAPAPEPPPEPPEPPDRVTGMRLVEVGKTFIEWAWDPVEGATGYEVEVFLALTPPGQRGEPIITVEPAVRAEDLEPGTAYEIYARAIREAEGGRAAGQWSAGFGSVETVPTGPPLPCTDERQRGLTHSPWVRWWDGTPYRVDIISNFPEGVSEADVAQLLEAITALDEKIERQLGYRIVEMGEVIPVPEGAPPGWNTDEEDYRATCPVLADPGQIIAFYMADENHGAPGTWGQANNECGSFSYMRPMMALWPCPGCNRDGLTLHELFHVLGFVHETDYDFLERGEGVPMTGVLSWSDGEGASTVLWQDIDYLRCIFPEGGR